MHCAVYGHYLRLQQSVKERVEKKTNKGFRTNMRLGLYTLYILYTFANFLSKVIKVICSVRKRKWRKKIKMKKKNYLYKFLA